MLWTEVIWMLMMLFWVGVAAVCLYGYPRLRALAPSVSESNADDQVKREILSVIVAAKNEEAAIGQTLRDLLHQTLAGMELIVVNDRSSDRTGEVLMQLAGEAATIGKSLKIITIDELPVGWLGKNHALWRGVQESSGQWLLFADADIRFHKDTLVHAMNYMKTHQVDHLALSPAFIAETVGLRGFISLFLFALNLVLRPWRCNDDRQRKHGVGIGAFNMIRRSVYEAVGTHEAIALRPDDDLMLGTKIKQARFRQRFLLGRDWLTVEWYPSVGEAVRGLEKNVYAGMGYQPLRATVVIAGFFFQFHCPFWLAVIGWYRDAAWLALPFVLEWMLITWAIWYFSRWRPWEMILLPWTSLVVSYTLARSVILAHLRGGVNWRGTFYRLDELKTFARRQDGA